MRLAIRLANDSQHCCHDRRGYRTAVRSRTRKVPCRFLNGRSSGRIVEPVVTRRRDTTDRAVGAEQLRRQDMLALCCDASYQRVFDQLQNHVFAIIVADSRDTSCAVVVYLVPSSGLAGSETRSLSRTRRTGGRGSPTCRRKLSTAKPWTSETGYVLQCGTIIELQYYYYCSVSAVLKLTAGCCRVNAVSRVLCCILSIL